MQDFDTLSHSSMTVFLASMGNWGKPETLYASPAPVTASVLFVIYVFTIG